MNVKKLISILLSITLLIFVFCGCIGCETVYARNLKRIKETEYFRYINYEGEDTVTILELTELGKQQEVLVIPEEIDGMKVVALGGVVLGSSLGPRPDFMLKSDCLKKVYMKAKKIQRGAWYGNQTQRIIFINEDFRDSCNMSDLFIRNANCYFYDVTAVLDLLEDSPYYLEYGQRFLETNIRFWVDDELWWLDVADDDCYLSPDIPTKPDKTFVGWYTEPEFINEWNEEYRIPKGQETLNLYAKFE